MMQKGDPTNSLNMHTYCQQISRDILWLLDGVCLMVHKSFYDVLQVDANAAIDEMLVGDFRYGFDLSKDGGYPKMAISISVVFL